MDSPNKKAADAMDEDSGSVGGSAADRIEIEDGGRREDERDDDGDDEHSSERPWRCSIINNRSQFRHDPSPSLSGEQIGADLDVVVHEQHHDEGDEVGDDGGEREERRHEVDAEDAAEEEAQQVADRRRRLRHLPLHQG